MIVTMKNLLSADKSVFSLIIVIAVYAVSAAALIYGSRKHSVSEIIKSPAVIIFIFTILIESAYYTLEKYFRGIMPVDGKVIIYINSGIFIIGVVISLIDERYYMNAHPVTICRISAYTLILSLILIIIEFILIAAVAAGVVLIIIAALNFNKLKKKILFWRNRT